MPTPTTSRDHAASWPASAGILCPSQALELCLAAMAATCSCDVRAVTGSGPEAAGKWCHFIDSINLKQELLRCFWAGRKHVPGSSATTGPRGSTGAAGPDSTPRCLHARTSKKDSGGIDKHFRFMTWMRTCAYGATPAMSLWKWSGIVARACQLRQDQQLDELRRRLQRPGAIDGLTLCQMPSLQTTPGIRRRSWNGFTSSSRKSSRC